MIMKILESEKRTERKKNTRGAILCIYNNTYQLADMAQWQYAFCSPN